MPILNANHRKPSLVKRLEQTPEQVLTQSGYDGELIAQYPLDWFRKVRKMRRDPTIAFVRDLMLAPIIIGQWTVETDDEKWDHAVDAIWDMTKRLRIEYLRNAMRGLLDFGWQPFEKIMGFQKRGRYLTIERLKPLLQDFSTILVDPFGNITNVRVEGRGWLPFRMPDCNPMWVDLTPREYMLVIRDVEGTEWYGEPIMRRVEDAYDSHLDCERSAKRYDRKLAGSHWVIHYPPGMSTVEGVEVDNYVLAKNMLQNLESSGQIVVPQKVLGFVEDLSRVSDDNVGWRIELLSSSAAQSSFIDRQRYLDTLKVRGLGFAERSVLEGQFGTRAEADAHADFTITNIEMIHQDIVNSFNKQCTDHVLKLNYGEEAVGRVYVQLSPLTDEKRAGLRDLYMQYFNSEEGKASEFETIDWEAIRDKLDIPYREDAAHDADVDESAKTSLTRRKPSVGKYQHESRLHFKRNAANMQDILNKYSSGDVTEAGARTLLEMLGFEDEKITALLDDVTKRLEPIAAAWKASHNSIEYGCVTLPVPDMFDELRQGIQESDVVAYEHDPHVTALYGILADVPSESVEALLSQAGRGMLLQFGGIEVFKTDDADVVHIAVESRALRKLHDMLSQRLPNEDPHPVYQPHITLAYCKPGTGDQYVGTSGFENLALTITKAKYHCGEDDPVEYTLSTSSRCTHGEVYELCGGKGGTPGPCPKGTKKSKGSAKTSAPKPARTPKPKLTARTKSEIAKASAKRVDKTIQRYSEEHNEPMLADSIGGEHVVGNGPVDVQVKIGKKLHGIELKTVTTGENDKITMKKSAMQRKADWGKENDGVVHTVVFDDRDVFNANGEGKHDFSKRKILYRRGFGSFRIGGMEQIPNTAALKKILSTPTEKLSKAAGGG